MRAGERLQRLRKGTSSKSHSAAEPLAVGQDENVHYALNVKRALRNRVTKPKINNHALRNEVLVKNDGGCCDWRRAGALEESGCGGDRTGARLQSAKVGGSGAVDGGLLWQALRQRAKGGSTG